MTSTELKKRHEMTSFSQLCEDTMRRQIPISEKADPYQTLNLLVPCSWTSQPSELGEINVCGLSHSLYGIFGIADLTDTHRFIVYSHQLSCCFLFAIRMAWPKNGLLFQPGSGMKKTQRQG